MLSWYFKQTKTTVGLGTTPDTRAEQFYLKAGWTETCKHGRGEIKFEMNYNDWVKKPKTKKVATIKDRKPQLIKCYTYT